MTKYTPEVKAIVRSMPVPYKNLIIDVVEYKDYLAVRFYRDNVEGFPDTHKVPIAEYLYRLRDMIRLVEPKCHIEGVEHAPPNIKTSPRGA